MGEETETVARCDRRCMRMTDRGLCDRCARLLKGNLIELEQIYCGLSLERGQSNGDKVSGSKEPPLPLRLDVLSWLGPVPPGDAVHGGHEDDQVGAAPLLATLGSWARLIAEERGLSAGHVDSVITFLLRHHEWSSEQPWADDYAAEIADQVAIGRSLGGLWRLTHRLDGVPCPRCTVCALTRQDGDEWVLCQSCGAGWSWEHYESLTKTLADALREAS